jgi:predicted nucleic acid-binding protein
MQQIIYLDSSALVKRYLNEVSSEDVNGLIESADILGSVKLTRTEIASALQKAVRMGWAERSATLQAWQDFLQHWETSFAKLGVSDLTIEKAASLAWEYGLRGYDAVHLASALLWQDAIVEPITFATYDRELWLAAQKSGIPVWPQGLVR